MSLRTARANILDALSRFSNKENPDNIHKEIFQMLKELDEIVYKFILKNASDNMLKKIHEDILNKLDKNKRNTNDR